MTTSAWPDSFTTIEVEVPCSGATHRVRWKRGKVELVDHDLRSESALHALGGDVPACLDVLQSWRDVCRAEKPVSPWAQPTQFGFHTASTLSSTGAVERAFRSLPDQLRRRLAVATLRRCERAWRRGDLAPAMEAQLHRHLSHSVAEALKTILAVARNAGIRTEVQLAVHAAPVGTEPSLDVSVQRTKMRVEATLPLTWLIDVWGAGAGAVDGHLVLVRDGDRAVALRIELDNGALHARMVGIELAREDDRWQARESSGISVGAAGWWSVRSGR